MAQADTENYFRSLCEHLGIALIATDSDLTIRVWNATASRTFGAGAERMIGSPIIQVIPPKHRRMAERMLRRAIRSGETMEIRFDHRDGEGNRRELAGTIAAVVSPTGKRVGASICIRDITRRIALQNELHESRKMAALGEMAGAIAHHFNNILGGAMTSIDYANASDNLIRKARVLQQVGPALQRAATLINGLLAFAEGDRRQEDLSDFTEIMNQLADEMEGQMRNRGIDFSLSLPPLPVLPFPRAALSTLLQNMTQNAIEAMPDGGSLRIDVSLDRDSLIIRIRDTGCGFDESVRSRLFEPFWSTKQARRDGSEQGVGLGLAVVHGLVQMLGGSITVTSKLGEGSCFCVTLPLPANGSQSAS